MDGYVIFALEESIEANASMFPGYKAQAQLEDEKRALQLELEGREDAQASSPNSSPVTHSPLLMSSSSDEDLREQLEAAREKIRSLTASLSSTNGGGGGGGIGSIPRTATGLSAKFDSSNLVGKRVIVEGFHSTGTILKYEKSSSRGLSSRHKIKFDGMDEEESVILARTKNGSLVGSRFVILE